ncbi:5'/3'-nucleotidase SurE [Paractinoplanes brasiliensis]|uniref:5'-nucleotidase n=1 Tax=Paractinoplanes brasiliensis TaxID=52695 RepID=A0A4R6K2U7_9ACTN|nr:5'/3'-nucleotidase SurE [Actinoplanes brasiliensis]TDO42491.1 5'-nucleotidase [Actinoplanes brasiliensis]GID31407.1 5'/3'-nucleotidase SurE [Actinoplanes brasiliensis]
MRVLVTNDDGIAAPGLAALASAVPSSYEVVVAAPREEASGLSSALTAVVSDGQIMITPADISDLSAYGVAASPAYIVVLASLGVFGPPPDLVLSGINRGANAGRAVLHSATVGAALTAANYGMRAMAVSLDVLHPSAKVSAASGGNAIVLPSDDALHWGAAATTAASLLGVLEEAPKGTVFNVNVPDRPAPPDLREATLASFGQAGIAVAEAGEGFVRTTIERVDEPLVPGTDLALLADGYATVTALRPPAEVPGIRIPAQRRVSS